MIISNDDFWNEVRLLSLNNYGEWDTKEEAEQRVKRAIRDTVQGVQNQLKHFKLNKSEQRKITLEMMESLK